MGSFVSLDRQKLLNGELGVRESSGGKIAFFEFGKSLGIKLGLELFQDVREFYTIKSKSAPRPDMITDQTQNRNKVARERTKGRVRTEDQEVRRSVLPFPRSSGHKERGGESDNRSSETHCVNIKNKGLGKEICCWKLRFKRREGLLDKRVLRSSRAVQGRYRATQKKKKLQSGRQHVLGKPRKPGLTHGGKERMRRRGNGMSINNDHPPFLYVSSGRWVLEEKYERSRPWPWKLPPELSSQSL